MTGDERAELAWLRAEKAELRMERDEPAEPDGLNDFATGELTTTEPKSFRLR